MTDANLLLGYLDADAPLAGGVQLDREAAERAVGGLAEELDLSVEETAAGIARVAATEMAQAARVVTVERGIDPRELALVSFGGAGGLHAAAIADELGMQTVVAPMVAGVLSALGLAVSERRRDLVESVLLGGDGLEAEAIAGVVERLAAQGREELDAPDAQVRPTYELRYAGQAFELPIEAKPDPDPADLRAAFDDAHEERYGYRDDEAALELVTVRVAVALPGSEAKSAAPEEAERRGSRSARFGDEWQDTEIVGAGTGELEGPAIVELPGSTLVVPPGWSAKADGDAVVMHKGGE